MLRLLAIALLLFCASCTGAPTAPDAHAAPFGLPALSELPALKAAAAVTTREGNQYFDSGPGVTSVGSDGIFDPPAGQASWALFFFGSQPDEQLLNVSFVADNLDTGAKVWVAISDYTANRWRIVSTTFPGGSFDFSDNPGTFCNGSTTYVAVLGVGGGFTLDNVSADIGTPIHPGWIHSWGAASSQYGQALVVNANGVFVYVRDSSASPAVGVLLKYSLAGDLLASKQIQLPGGMELDPPALLLEATNGELWFTAPVFDGSVSQLLLKLDSDLNVLFAKVYDPNFSDSEAGVDGAAVNSATGDLALGGMLDYNGLLALVSDSGSLVWDRELDNISSEDLFSQLAIEPAAGTLHVCGSWKFGSSTRGWQALSVDSAGALLFAVRETVDDDWVFGPPPMGCSYDTSGNTVVLQEESGDPTLLGSADRELLLHRLSPAGALTQVHALGIPGEDLRPHGVMCLLNISGNLRLRANWPDEGVHYFNVIGATFAPLNYMQYSGESFSSNEVLVEYNGSFYSTNGASSFESAQPVPSLGSGMVGTDATADITLETSPGTWADPSGTVTDLAGVSLVDVTAPEDAFASDTDATIVRYDPSA